MPLFKVYRDLDSFLECVDKRKENAINIYLRCFTILGVFDSILKLEPRLITTTLLGMKGKSEAAILEKRLIKHRYDDLSGELMVRESLLRHFRKAFDYYDLLNSYGYNISINGEHPERAKRKMNFLEAKIEALKDNLVDYMTQ